MDFLKKHKVAVILAFAFILAAIGIGQMKHQPSSGVRPGQGTTQTVSIAEYHKWIWDDANVLSDTTEHKICQHNEDWDYRYNSVVGIVTTNSANDLEEFAWEQGANMGMGEGDALLAISVKDSNWFVAPGEDFSTILTNRAVSELEDILSGDLNDKTVLAFYAQLDKIYKENFGMGNEQSGAGYDSDYTPYNPPRQSSQAGSIITIVILLLTVIVVINIVDRARYNSYRRQYYGVVDPPYAFRPIFFWHGPNYGWYRRHWRQPPPPPPPGPRGPGYGGGPRLGGPGYGGGPRPGVGPSRPRGGGSSKFGGMSNNGPRGGGTFGGRPSGSSHSGGFGGSFGSGSRPGGGSRGGGFSGGSRGGSFGGSRGGGFSGGSRGGGFGGRR